MGSLSRSLLDHLDRERRDFQRRLSVLRRARSHVGPAALGEDGSLNPFDAAAEVSTIQHEEVLTRRLADKSQALAEAMAQLREGTYGLCRACGGRIPRRRLEAVPTATHCVRCQEEVEAARAA